MFYVGNGDAETVGDEEVVVPFGDAGEGGVETNGAVSEGELEAFPSSSVGIAASEIAPMICPSRR